MQCVHAGSFPSHLIFFFRHMSQACGRGISLACVPRDKARLRRGNGGSTHTCDPPPLCLVCVVEQSIGVSEHLGRELGRQVLHWQTIVGMGAEDLRRLVHKRRMRHGGHLEATHMVIHGDVEAQIYFDWRGLDGPGPRLVQRMGLGLGSGAAFLCWYYRLRRAARSSSGIEDWEARVFVFEIWCTRARARACS